MDRVYRLASASGPRPERRQMSWDYPRIENAAHHSSTTQMWEAARVPAPSPVSDPELFGASLHLVVWVSMGLVLLLQDLWGDSMRRWVSSPGTHLAERISSSSLAAWHCPHLVSIVPPTCLSSTSHVAHASPLRLSPFSTQVLVCRGLYILTS